VLDWLVGDTELCQVMTDHLWLKTEQTKAHRLQAIQPSTTTTANITNSGFSVAKQAQFSEDFAGQNILLNYTAR